MTMTSGSIPAALPGGLQPKAKTMGKPTGMSPRKGMAMGGSPDAAFAGLGSIPHPDASMQTGKVMAEANRGVPPPITNGANMATMQPADHGPHHMVKVR